MFLDVMKNIGVPGRCQAEAFSQVDGYDAIEQVCMSDSTQEFTQNTLS